MKRAPRPTRLITATVFLVLSILAIARVAQEDAWLPTSSMSTSRIVHTATLLSDGRVLVTGGYDSSSYLASAEIYNPATNNWSSARSMSSARGYHTATLLSDSRVLVTGGYDGSSFWASWGIYISATASWSSARSMSPAGGH